jgi:hypothetical protein
MTKAILDSNFLVALIDEKDKGRKSTISTSLRTRRTLGGRMS